MDRRWSVLAFALAFALLPDRLRSGEKAGSRANPPSAQPGENGGVAEDARDTLDKAGDTVRNEVETAGDTAKDAADDVIDGGKNVVHDAADAVRDAVDGVGNAAKDIVDGADNAANSRTAANRENKLYQAKERTVRKLSSASIIKPLLHLRAGRS